MQNKSIKCRACSAVADSCEVKLKSFDGSDFDKGRSIFVQTVWYFVNALIVRASWNPFMKIKVWILKLFGAKIGKGLVIKNDVTIKFPWKLTIGNDVWLGEGCWIDNLDDVTIGNSVCISQGALLITGNHDYTKSNFPYRNAPIIIGDGAWIGAKAVVGPGVKIAPYSVLTIGTIATRSTEQYGIYQGNPAVKINVRRILE